MAKHFAWSCWYAATAGLILLVALSAAQSTDDNDDVTEEIRPPTTAAAPIAAPPTTVSTGPSFTSTNPLSLNACPEDSITFELITGYVYSAPADMLDSQPGTLMLTDCIQACRQNRTCKSVNYETGLCVLFSSNSDSVPGK